MKKALIAMSGGVDSSVAAYLMKDKGFECIGATMKLYDNPETEKNQCKTCCSLNDVEDARSVAYKIGIPYYVFNFKDDFKSNVIDRFIYAYENGFTPNPCIDCNRYLKFNKLYNRAKILGYNYIVTGHYARITCENGRYLLKKALDDTKDQSYVLYSLTQEQLQHTIFPLGDMTKNHTRQIAEEQGLINAHKHDSQDICFVPDGNYAKVIEQYTGKKYLSGDYIDCDGNILGKHKGIIHYTIGQHKGLGISTPERMYVCGIKKDNNYVILGTIDKLYSKEFDADNFNWISYDEPPKEIHAKAKIRYRQLEQPATIISTGKDTVHIIFDEPQKSVTPGQSVVVYDGDTVIGGGLIISK